MGATEDTASGRAARPDGTTAFRRSLLLARKSEGELPQAAVALDRRVVAVRMRPVGAHPAGALGILERVVERKERHALMPRELGNQLVQPPDLRLRVRPAVVPRQHVGDRDAEAELLPPLHYRPQIGRGVLHRTPLGDVVDPALDDENVRPARAGLEPGQDLIRPLPVDPEVPELEARVDVRRPVLPLTRLVAAAARVVSGRSLRDRVAERDDDDFYVTYADRSAWQPPRGRPRASGRGRRRPGGRSPRRCPISRGRDRGRSAWGRPAAARTPPGTW